MTLRTPAVRRRLVHRWMRAALEAVDPVRCTHAAVGALEREGVSLAAATVFAFGKASRGMAEAAVARGIVKDGILIAPARRDGPLPPLRVRRGGHPVPSPDAAEVGREVLELARSLGEDDVALCLISGGGSAMLELPVEGVSLEQIRRETERLLASGADIVAINRARAAMSQLKGGKLAEAMAPARIVNVVISDVPGADAAVVASGPTIPAPGSAAAAKTTTVIAADNAAARRAVVEAAAGDGLRLEDLGEVLRGDAHEMGRALLRLAEERRQAGAAGVIAGGETTVTLSGPAGKGGRNHELALAAWDAIVAGAPLTLAAFGTDGVDGNSAAAGAILDEVVVARARERGLDPAAALSAHDTAPFFATIRAQLRTGPTGTNVADLAIVLR